VLLEREKGGWERERRMEGGKKGRRKRGREEAHKVVVIRDVLLNNAKQQLCEEHPRAKHVNLSEEFLSLQQETHGRKDKWWWLWQWRASAAKLVANT
jgi:hypothetical protein